MLEGLCQLLVVSDVSPTNSLLLYFIGSGIQLYILLRHHLCFISFLNVDLYVLVNDSWMS